LAERTRAGEWRRAKAFALGAKRFADSILNISRFAASLLHS
jgi:hypothetical protein